MHREKILRDFNHYYNPVHTVQGRGAVQELPNLLRELAGEKGRVLLLVWDNSVLERAVFQKLGERFQVRSICFTESNPTVEQLFALYEKTKEFSPQAVAAVGGGSVMDVGKSLCCLYGQEIGSAKELREIISRREYRAGTVRWIGIPTTSGTGSEVTCWATIWDPKENLKRSVEDRDNYAYAAVADPDLTDEMPLGLAVSSALDAVAHAVESYWAKGSNMTSRILALGAVRTIMKHIECLLAGDSQAHDYMSQGSLLAGLAFSNTKTTACHSISYPLTMQYHIPHGTAVSLLLGPVMAVNQADTEEISLLLGALGVSSAGELEEKIRDILRRAGIPASLSEWKVEHGRLPELARLGITKGRADNNPVNLTPVMIENLLEAIY